MRIKTTEKSLLHRMLTIVIFRTQNEKRAKNSKFQYGKNKKGYFLRPLGILHRWMNLTLELPEITKDFEDI